MLYYTLECSIAVERQIVLTFDYLFYTFLYSGILLRPALELKEIYTFLSETMGLESIQSIRASLNSSKERHLRRHSTNLSLVQCPAWEMSLDCVRARYELIRFAGCWPLSKSVYTGMSNVYFAILSICYFNTI